MSKKLMDKMKKLPVDRVIIPFDGAVLMRNRYWIIIDNCILFWNGHSPQCNHKKEIAEMIKKKLYPDAEIRFLADVYLENEF